MTFGLQCDEDDVDRDPRPRRRGRRHVPRHRRRVPARRRPHDRRPHRGDRRPVAARASASSSSSRRSASARWARSRWDMGNSRRHIMDASTRRCAGLQTDFDRPLPAALRRSRACRSTRRSARSTTSCASGKVRYVGCSNFLAYQLARALGRSEARGFVRFDSRAAALQPAVPRVRARAVPAVPRRRHRRHPLQPDRGRHALGQARPVEAARRGHAVHARQRGRACTRIATGTTTCSTPSTSS